MEPLTISIRTEAVGLEEKLENLPASPGVYQHKDASGTVLYVGKARNLRNRVRQYFQKARGMDRRIERMLSLATDLEIIVTDSEVEALILEANLIKRLKPRYNVLLKDDKSYPYIVVTNEPFPRVFVTRHIRRDGSHYFGPYTDVKNVRAALKAVRDLFQIRSCNFPIDEEAIARKKYRLCLDYQIKKCGGPCEGLVTREAYGGMIEQAAALLRGKTESLIRDLRAEMERHAEGLRFEDAALLRDRIRGLEAYSERQKAVDLDAVDRDIVGFVAEADDACGVIFKLRDGKIVGRQHYYMGNVSGRGGGEILETLLQQHYLENDEVPREVLLPEGIDTADALAAWLTGKRKEEVRVLVPEEGEEAKLVRLSVSNARFLLDDLKVQKLKKAGGLPFGVAALQKDLRLANPPRRIECFDISNIQGSDAVASMVVFADGKPRKGDYRKFRIGSVEGPDDFASMREVIRRRYTRVLEEQGTMPDLIMVDGGKGQLSSAVEVLAELGLGAQPIIGLAKRLEEVYRPGESDPELIGKASAGLKLLQRVRDEAHRFAITYHRSLRAKRTLQTELDLIEGIGKVRAKELLEAFGSVQGVKHATEEQLADVVGPAVAGKIREYFSTTDQNGGEP